MEYPDAAIEGISKRIIPLPQHGVEPFVNDHLATVNYRLPSGEKSEETNVRKERAFYANNSIWEAILYEGAYSDESGHPFQRVRPPLRA